MTRQLLAFGRKQILEPKTFDLNAVVRSSLSILRRLVGEDIEFVTELDPRQLLIRADPVQIEQVLLNLVVNARDAMTSGGRLLIGTAAERAESSSAPPGEERGRTHVVLTVSDSGMGIDPQVKDQIFDPFFTTKEPGSGTGLGLSTVHGVVKQTGGHIEVDSAVDRGTTFRLFFPESDGHPEALRTPEIDARSSAGTETVLVVEDEDQVRVLVEESLNGAGYSVLSANGGEQALDVTRQFTGRIDLLLTDVIMPGMNGKEVYRQVVKMRPEIGVLYMSGHTDRAIVHRGLLEKGINFIQKPFSPDRLVLKVRQALDGRGDAATIPARPISVGSATASANAAAGPTTETLPASRILVVDDDPVNRLLLQGMVKALGARADAVGNGIDAVEETGRGGYDLVLMDCRMPGMDGYEATEMIRRREQVERATTLAATSHPRLTIVAISGAADAQDRVKCLSVGMDDLLAKPVDLERLGGCLRQWLGEATAGAVEMPGEEPIRRTVAG